MKEDKTTRIRDEITRIEEVIKDNNLTMPAFQRRIGIESQHWNNWKNRGVPARRRGEISDVFGINSDWIRTGEGAKHKNTESNNLQQDAHDESERPTPRSLEAAKLFCIIDAADQAMNDSGYHFTEEERLENYFEALDFAGRKHFSNELVKQYLAEMMRANVSEN